VNREVEAFGEGPLALELDLVIALTAAAIADSVHRAILRIRHQERGQRQGRLVIIGTVNDGRVQVVIEGVGDLQAQGSDIARKLLQYIRVDCVQLLNVMLVAAIEEVGERSYKPAGQLSFEADVEPVVKGLRQVLRVPKQVLPATAYVRAQGLACYWTEIRKERIGRRKGIRQGRLGHAVRQWSYILVTRHAEERRLREVECLRSR